MTTRPLRFELHIRPLIRLIDRENMLRMFGLDLWDYDQVRARAEDILDRIQADMPPPSYGGPWPEEWIALFQRWYADGCLRLDLGSVESPGYRAVRAGNRVTLTGRGRTPTGGYKAWFDAIRDYPREFVLYWEPPVTAQPSNPTPFQSKAVFESPADQTEIIVVDSAGRHSIAIS